MGAGSLVGEQVKSGANNCYTRLLHVMIKVCTVVSFEGHTEIPIRGEVREGFQEEVSVELSLGNQKIKAHMLFFNSLLSPDHKVKRS